MLERDYIIRLIREFMAALQRILNQKNGPESHEELIKLYEQYIGSYSLYHTAPAENVIELLSKEDKERGFYKIEMLAELYYAEADMVSKPEADVLLQKAFLLFDYLEYCSKVYSMDRLRKMDSIKQRLSVNPIRLNAEGQ